MTKPRSFYIKIFVLFYLTRYPHSTRAQIVGGGRYSRDEIEQALDELLATGVVELSSDKGTHYITTLPMAIVF